MAIPLLQDGTVKDTGPIKLKFYPTVDATTIVNANFALAIGDATPVPITNPFVTIDLIRDYDSLSRILNLYFNTDLELDTTYTLTVSNIKDVIGVTWDPDGFSFTTSATAPFEEIVPPIPEIISVEDHSVKSISDINFAVILETLGVGTLKLLSIKPGINESYYLDPSFNEGRIEIYFNAIPAANYISTDYFKVQRKLISRSITRWESVDVLVTSDPSLNLVMIYLPSVEDVPQYGEPDLTYYESTYKYRLRILGSIGVSRVVASTLSG